METLLSRKHNSYSEAFTSYVANALKQLGESRSSVTIVRYPFQDITIHLHGLMIQGPGNAQAVAGYVIFKFNSATEGITMLYLSTEDVGHFAPVIQKGQLNRELIDRMIDLLPDQVQVGIGADSWSHLREVFLQYVYGTAPQDDRTHSS